LINVALHETSYHNLFSPTAHLYSLIHLPLLHNPRINNLKEEGREKRKGRRERREEEGEG
jgi:hypothetical protein